MKRFGIICLLMVVSATGFAQIAARDSLIYTSSARLTTAYTGIYLGPVGIQKQVDIAFDTTAATTSQIATTVVGGSADTNNTAKKYLTRLLYRQTVPTFSTFKDTVWIKLSASSVLVSLLSRPFPLALTR